jgi:DNA-binding NtrC family response regulator
MMNPARLAVVDDDPAFKSYLSTLLGSRGYDVDTYSSGTELLQAMSRTPGPDVVLLDVLMPGMNGLETLKALRAASPMLPVIMLSGQQVPKTIVDSVRLGAVDYVLKPDDADGIGEAALEITIRSALEKVSLADEMARLRAQVSDDADGMQPYWGECSAMRPVLAMVERVADSDVTVLITGESGVGKEVIARELHRRSRRRAKNFVKVNCAALPADLLESELFGHERGAFTGAQATRVGKFEFANEGTILLDEIGEMPASLQAKLLHVLEDSTFSKLGSNRPVELDVRIIASTNRELDSMMRSGQFREDLYYRLQVIEIHVPPLRARRAEIIPLVEFFLIKYAERYGRTVMRPSQRLRDALLSYHWPGNVRELENVVKRYVILQDDGLVLAELERAPGSIESPSIAAAALAASPTPEATPIAVTPMAAAADPIAAAPIPAPMPAPVAAPPPMVAAPAPPVAPAPPPIELGETKLPKLARQAALVAEREAISLALERFRWNRRKAAKLLGVSYKTLLNKMKECGISASS